jgi:hypothetical protein
MQIGMKVAVPIPDWGGPGVGLGGITGPSTGDGILLEDGAFFLLLEDGSFLLLE